MPNDTNLQEMYQPLTRSGIERKPGPAINRSNAWGFNRCPYCGVTYQKGHRDQVACTNHKIKHKRIGQILSEITTKIKAGKPAGQLLPRFEAATAKYGEFYMEGSELRFAMERGAILLATALSKDGSIRVVMRGEERIAEFCGGKML